MATPLGCETLNQLPGTRESTLLTGRLHPCFRRDTAQGVGFFMCVGGRLGSFRGEGHYTEGSKSSVSAWWALAGSGQGRFWLSRAIAIGTSVEALYALSQREIVVDPKPGEMGPTLKREVPQLGLAVTIGPVFRVF